MQLLLPFMKSPVSFGAKQGFTFIEVLLVSFILVMLVGVAAPFFRDFLVGNDLETASIEMLAMVRRARTLAEAGRHNQPFGIAVNAGGRSVTLFAGSSFASRDPQFDEAMTFPGTLTVSGLSEFTFLYQSGLPTQTGIITFTAPALGESRAIFVNAQGLSSF